MKCEKCGVNDITQTKWRWEICDELKCVNEALLGPMKPSKCEFCGDPSSSMFWNRNVCSKPVCRELARDSRLPDFGNMGKTTFSKAPKYTAAQERKWSEFKEATGFKE